VAIIPLIETGPPDDAGRALREVWQRRQDFDWLALSSATAVEVLKPLFERSPVSSTLKVAAVGPATARALRQVGIAPALVGDGAGGAALADLLEREALSGSVLIVAAQEGRPELAERLIGHGWRVEAVPGYTTRTRRLRPQEREALVASDLVVLASPSAVAAYEEAVGPSNEGAAVLVTIGPTTAEAAREISTRVLVASSPDDDGLVEAVMRAIGGRR
jgi:uroporphyrinogen-III synthase